MTVKKLQTKKKRSYKPVRDSFYLFGASILQKRREDEGKEKHFIVS